MFDIDKFILDAINEDIPTIDVTTDNLISDDNNSFAILIAKEDGILSGIDIFKRVFELVGNNVNIDIHKNNGDELIKGDLIATLSGNTKTMLKGERVALNILQRMCGVATLTSKYVAKLKGNTKLLDTRKTTPLFRYFEKRAVLDGKGINHRYSLSDMVMIKDNHIKASKGITNAVKIIKEKTSNIKVEVEVENIIMFKEALETDCDIIMLDNMNIDMMRECVKLNNSKKQLEASGNMTLQRISDVSALGVDFISVGAITHSYSSLDISLKFK